MLGKAASRRCLPRACGIHRCRPGLSPVSPGSQLLGSDVELGGHVTLRSGPVGGEQVPGRGGWRRQAGRCAGTNGLRTGWGRPVGMGKTPETSFPGAFIPTSPSPQHSSLVPAPLLKRGRSVGAGVDRDVTGEPARSTCPGRDAGCWIPGPLLRPRAGWGRHSQLSPRDGPPTHTPLHTWLPSRVHGPAFCGGWRGSSQVQSPSSVRHLPHAGCSGPDCGSQPSPTDSSSHSQLTDERTPQRGTVSP